MQAVAVIDLDRWISQLNSAENDASIVTRLNQITQQYQQCRTVYSFIFCLTYRSRFRTINSALTNLGIVLQPKECVDPLNAFYELVSQAAFSPGQPNSDLAIVRLLASAEPPDCGAIDAMVLNHINEKHHYSRRTRQHKMAELDLEIMNLSVLREAWQEALLPDDRQLITPYIYRQQQRLNLGTFPSAAAATLHA